MKSLFLIFAVAFSSSAFAARIPFLSYTCTATSEILFDDNQIDIQKSEPFVVGYVNKAQVGIVGKTIHTAAGEVRLGMQISIYGIADEYMEGYFFDYVEDKSTGFPSEIFNEATISTPGAPLPFQFGIVLKDRELNGYIVRNDVECSANLD